MTNHTFQRAQNPIHFLSVNDFSNEDYEKIFRDAAHIKQSWQRVEQEIFKTGQGRSVTLLFVEPSTRTSMSFDKAAQALGCRTSALNINSSSIAKGESFTDTLCMAGLRSDILVVRHAGEAGTLRSVADNVFPRYHELADVSIINGGEGTGEHPTQALLDLFTIQEHFGRTNVRIGFLGDLNHGRTCHSLITLGARFGASFACVAPEAELQMPEQYLAYAERLGTRPICASDIRDVIGDLDVLYVTRLQKERLPHELHHRYSDKQSGYCVTPKLLELFPKNSILMHPLPRLDELSIECDRDPRAKYMTQADNGIVTRTALLRHCLTLGG